MTATVSLVPPAALDHQVALRAAVDQAVEHLWRTQRSDGSWESFCEVGPVATAQMLVTLHYIGRLDPADANEAARWLMAQQRDDGSWEGHPFADRGDLGTTATALAALHVSGIPEDAAAIRRARDFLDALGGFSEVVRGLARGELAAINLALAGLLEPSLLPRLPLTHCLVQPLRKALERRFNGAVLTVLLQSAILVRRLQGDWGPDGLSKPTLDEQACRYCLSLLDEFQNADGSWWNGVTPWSGLILATLHAMALPECADRIERGLRPIDRFRVHDEGGLHWAAFGNGVWATSFNVRALLAADVNADDARLVRACDWLLGCQIDRPQSSQNNRRTDVPRTGGWSFQRENETLPDTDDTAVALSALGMAGERSSNPAWAENVRCAVKHGLAWTGGMKNADGGWASYVWGMPERPLGPIMDRQPNIDFLDPAGLATALFEPPVELGDPSYEDLAGRILHALGQAGMSLEDSDVQKGIEFLRLHQFPDGRWWGRWINYVVASSFVLTGAKAVGVDLRAEWIQQAIGWLLSRQNADGGWGETHLSYRHPERGGIAPSMPAVTGLVLTALCDMGLRDTPAVDRGVAYLLERQRADGSWDNNDFLHTLIAPDTFYYLPDASHYWPLEGLSRVLHDQTLGSPSRVSPKHVCDKILDQMRHAGDPEADLVSAELFRHGAVGEVNALIGNLARADGPLPRGLPPRVADFFEQSGVLPDWADAKQIQIAQQLFSRHGWETSLGLFCAALPQGYAASPCARCMGRTRSLTDMARRRVFETAQFLFDVLDDGGLSPQGRGIRACQKVRLMHGALRHLFTSDPGHEADGHPVNQEDMLGTLLLFCVTTLDVLRKLELPVSTAEAEAWVHTWAVIGHLLGVDRRLLPRSLADAEVKLLAFRRRHWGATPQGRELARALVELMQSYYPEPFAQVPVALIRYFSGPRCADLLGLPKIDMSRMAVETGIWLSGKWASGEVQEHFKRFAGEVVQRVMKGFFFLQAGGQLDWGEVLMEATRALALLAPVESDKAKRASPVRQLAYWLMKGLVLADRDGKQAPFHLPAAIGSGLSSRHTRDT